MQAIKKKIIDYRRLDDAAKVEPEAWRKYVEASVEWRNFPTDEDGDPAPGLWDRDKQQIHLLYPPLEGVHPTLEPFEPAFLELAPAEQANLVIDPAATRDYTIQTFGGSDTVMVFLGSGRQPQVRRWRRR